MSIPSESIITVTPSELVRHLRIHRKTGRPLFVRGGPGVGKSTIVRDFCREQKIGYVDLRVLYYDPTDLKGMPLLNAKSRKTEWLVPEDLPDPKRDGKEGILVLEELPSAAPTVQAACYQLCFERQVGAYHLPEGWFIVATGNRLGDKAVVNKVPSPLVSRFATHVQLDVSVDQWCDYAVKKGLAPQVVAFFRLRRELLNSFEPTKWQQDTPYCCPRTAEFLAEKVAAANGDGPLTLGDIASCVGMGVGAEFFGFMDIYKEVPSLDQILANPSKAPVPQNKSALWAVAAGLARKVTRQNADKVFTYLARLPKEFEVCAVRDALKTCTDLANTGAFVKWASANTDVFVNS